VPKHYEKTTAHDQNAANSFCNDCNDCNDCNYAGLRPAASGTSKREAALTIPSMFRRAAGVSLRFPEEKLSDPRICRFLMPGVLLVALLAQLRAATGSMFSYDELISVYISSLMAPSAILNALHAGVDVMPLLHYWLTGQFSRPPLDPM
jgi:hypothetical protein